MVTGKVVRVLSEKGFGWIRADDNSGEFFFHRSAYRGAFERVREGMSVEFTPNPSGPKGPRAEDVRPC